MLRRSPDIYEFRDRAAHSINRPPLLGESTRMSVGAPAEVQPGRIARAFGLLSPVFAYLFSSLYLALNLSAIVSRLGSL